MASAGVTEVLKSDAATNNVRIDTRVEYRLECPILSELSNTQPSVQLGSQNRSVSTDGITPTEARLSETHQVNDELDYSTTVSDEPSNDRR